MTKALAAGDGAIAYRGQWSQRDAVSDIVFGRTKVHVYARACGRFFAWWEEGGLSAPLSI
jgi:hypothetical protein